MFHGKTALTPHEEATESATPGELPGFVSAITAKNHVTLRFAQYAQRVKSMYPCACVCETVFCA